MHQSTSPRFASQILAVVISALMIARVTIAQSPTVESSSTEVITLQSTVDAFCAPDKSAYVTNRLPAGSKIEIVHRTADGWIGIRAPEDSFCWLAASDANLLPGGKRAQIVEDNTILWIGTDRKPPKALRWQTKLARDEEVTVIGEQVDRSTSGKETLWYQVVAPSTEARWIQANDLTRVTQSRSEPSEKSVSYERVPEPRKFQVDEDQPPKPITSRKNNSVVTASASEVIVQAQPNERATTTYEVPLSQDQHAPLKDPRWEQWQAFRDEDLDFGIDPLAPVHWLFSDFFKKNERAGIPSNVPVPMTPENIVSDTTHDPYFSVPDKNKAIAPTGIPVEQLRTAEARRYDQADPQFMNELASNLSRLPRPTRRRAHRSMPSDVSPWFEETQLANNMPSDNSPIGSGVAISENSNAVTAAGHVEANDRSNSWHGLLASAELPSTREATSSTTSATPLSSAVAPYQLEISSIVAQPIESWNLQPMRASIETAINQSSDPIQRGELRLVLERVDEFIALQRRNAALGNTTINSPKIEADSLGLSTSTQTRSPFQLVSNQTSTTPNTGFNTDPTPMPAAVATANSYFDASGWLVPVHTTHAGQPDYALTDDRGNIVTYLAPVPGLNARRYLRQPVGVQGRRGYLPELKTNTILAERITRLDR